MSKTRNEHDTAEAWLRAAVDGLRPDFEAIGKKLPAMMRGNFGFTSHGSKKTGVSGQYYAGGASADDIPKLIVRCNTDDPVVILEAVVHQCCHAVVGVEEGHGKAFRELALRIGLEPPMRTSKAGKRLTERLHALSAELGPFPNARLNFETTGADGKEKRVADQPKTQENRQLKVECLVDGCGYCARATAKWLRIGLPLCPVHREPMHPEKPLPEEIPAEIGEEVVNMPALSPPDAGQIADMVKAFILVMVVGTAFQGLLRLSRGRMASIWTSTLGRWLIGRMAGTAVFGGLLGTGYFLSIKAFGLLLDTLIRLNVPLSSALFFGILLTTWAAPIAAAWRLRTITKVCIGKGSRRLRRLLRSLGMGRGGSSAFAGICEEWANRWEPGMILLGASMYDRKWLVGIRDDRMMMTVAGTGAGKNRNSIIPNLMTYPGSIYCQDFKGQNAAVTAQLRREMGQTVHIFDPMGGLIGKGARLNPVEPLDPEARDYVEQIDSIVDAIVIGGDEKNRFFEDAARTLIAGLIDYVVRRDGKEEFKALAADAAMEVSDVKE